VHVFVLDAHSDDRTVEFARGAGAQVIEREWTDFVDARRYALAQVTTPWTLMLDADEALDDVLCDAICAAPEDVDGYNVRRTTYFCGHPMRIWRNELILRLFRTGRATLKTNPAASEDALVHEAWICDGPTAELPGTLLHFSYPDIAAYRAKYDRYTSLEAAQIRASFPLLLAACGASLARLGWLLFAKGALLDGPRGWYVAYRSAFYRPVAIGKALLQ
jgi:glycosyltransferase involved in cell wall biosynthesis